MKILLSVLLVSFATGTLFAKNCTTPEVKGVCPDKLIVEKAEWACKLIEEKGWDALPAIKTERFDCCDMPNYIWVNEFKDKEVKIGDEINLSLGYIFGGGHSTFKAKII